MKLIKVKAKVRLYSEEDLELLSKDLNLSLTEKWGKRTVGFHFYEIYRVINHSPGTCIVIFNDGEKLLVYESFNQFYNRWEECIKKDEKEEKPPEPEVEAPSEEESDEDEEEE